jgi:hypothetical protein
MLYLSSEQSILRKPELVWSVLADVPSFPSWVEGLVKVDHDEGPAFGLGSQYTVVWKLGGKKLVATTEITAFTDSRLLVTETRVKNRIVLFDRVSLEPVLGGTELDARSEVHEERGLTSLFTRSPGLLGSPEAERVEQRFYERSFRAFKLLVEARTAAPYR